MENEFRTLDIVLAVILAVVMLVGTSMFFVKRANDPSELTMENYEEYLKIGIGYTGTNIETDYTIVFRPDMRHKVTDVQMTLSLEGQSIASQTIDVSFSATYHEPYKYKITLRHNGKLPSNINDMHWYDIDYKVISVSGKIDRG